MADNIVNMMKCDTSKITFSAPEDDGGYIRSGVGYGKFKPHAKREDGKRMTDDDYIYVSTPPMQCYGLFPTYEYQKPRTDENINGYQFMVPLTSQDTVANPTADEKKIIAFFTGLRQQLLKFMVDNQSDLPEHYQAVDADKMGMMVNPIVSRQKKEEEGADKNPKKKAKKVEDETKPLMLFMPTLFYKKNAQFGTNVYGPGNKKVDPMKYSKIKGTIEMVIRIRYVNYGKKATFNMQLYEANYVPDPSAQTAPRRRLIADNTADESQDIDDSAAQAAPRAAAAAAKNLKPSNSYNPDGKADAKGKAGKGAKGGDDGSGNGGDADGDGGEGSGGGGSAPSSPAPAAKEAEPQYRIEMRDGKKVRIKIAPKK